MPDDPLPLAVVLDEVQGVLKRHGVAGYVVVGRREESEFRYVLEVPGFCVQTDGDRLRLQCHREDYPSLESQVSSLEGTLNFFGRLRTMAGACHSTVSRLLETVLPSAPVPPASALESERMSLPDPRALPPALLLHGEKPPA